MKIVKKNTEGFESFQSSKHTLNLIDNTYDAATGAKSMQEVEKIYKQYSDNSNGDNSWNQENNYAHSHWKPTGFIRKYETGFSQHLLTDKIKDFAYAANGCYRIKILPEDQPASSSSIRSTFQ
ncbi:MAG: hypothetical protein ACON46_07490 [Coraliomargaritaceae bacterium]